MKKYGKKYLQVLRWGYLDYEGIVQVNARAYYNSRPLTVSQLISRLRGVEYLPGSVECSFLVYNELSGRYDHATTYKHGDLFQ